MADKEIAKKIGISMGTVRTYWQRMRDKTDSRNRSEIISLTYQRSHSETLGELQRQQSRLAALLELSPVGLALLDEHLQVVELNSAFAAMMGVTVRELRGRSLSSVKGLNGVTLTAADDEDLVFLSGPCGLGTDSASYRFHRQAVAVEGEAYYALTLTPTESLPGYPESSSAVALVL